MLCGSISLNCVVAEDEEYAIHKPHPQTQPSQVTAGSPKKVCFTLEEAGCMAQKIIELESENARLKAKKVQRLGWTLGCGVGVGYDPVRLTADIEPVCGLTWGLRF